RGGGNLPPVQGGARARHQRPDRRARPLSLWRRSQSRGVGADHRLCRQAADDSAQVHRRRTVRRHDTQARPVSMRALAALLAAAIVTPAAAQEDAKSFPDRPVRIVVPFPAGGPTDVNIRILGQKLSEMWGQSVVVENRPGANTGIGAQLVAKAPADGYTL